MKMKWWHFLLMAIGVVALIIIGIVVIRDRWQFIADTPKGYEVLEAFAVVVGAVVLVLLLVAGLLTSLRGILKGFRRSKSQI